MLTMFSTPKPFVGHIDLIQRNAIRSWRRLHPEVEIILVGDDAGAAEVCKEFGIRHIEHVEKNRYGTKYLASIYDQVQEAARHEILCHVNCDIVLMSDFVAAARSVVSQTDRFLMAGRRWDVDLQHALDLAETNWETSLRQLARKTNRPRPAQWFDYFLFSKGLYYKKVPEFVIGRPGWDNWLLWYPLSIKVPVVDASQDVLAVHQNHQLHQGKFATLAYATHVLRYGRMKRNHQAWLGPVKRDAAARLSGMWFGLLN